MSSSKKLSETWVTGCEGVGKVNVFKGDFQGVERAPLVGRRRTGLTEVPIKKNIY